MLSRRVHEGPTILVYSFVYSEQIGLLH